MPSILARKALLADGWAERVRLRIVDGRIASVDTGAHDAEGDTLAGLVIPGITNAHSHAFQRALVGRTEERAPEAKDNFWTWRSRMYRLAGCIDAEAMTAVARQLYIEMLCAGYTGVAEFHYLHRETLAGSPSDAMFNALVTAARESGIRLTYVPVLYERAGFDEPQPKAEQRRFATTLDAFEAHYRRAQEAAAGTFVVGVGAHSLRAVTAQSLRRVSSWSQADGVPMHLHIAEQQREVEQCVAALGARPVRWLTEHFDIDKRWCLVHATHIDDAEAGALAGSGAVICLCPSTEGNLGDGLFPLRHYLECGGRIAIGSDSQVSIDPFEELRWLEYGQRLASQSRNVAALHGSHTGRSLFELALAGGSLAGGHTIPALAAGSHADLVVLDDQSPTLVGHETDTLLDALVFSGLPLPIDKVMVGGEWRVLNGRHAAAERAVSDYARAVRKLYPKEAPGM
jgi:formimidoylglutamate deiminase